MPHEVAKIDHVRSTELCNPITRSQNPNKRYHALKSSNLGAGGHGSVYQAFVQAIKRYPIPLLGVHSYRSLLLRGLFLPPYPLHSSSVSLLTPLPPHVTVDSLKSLQDRRVQLEDDEFDENHQITLKYYTKQQFQHEQQPQQTQQSDDSNTNNTTKQLPIHIPDVSLYLDILHRSFCQNNPILSNPFVCFPRSARARPINSPRKSPTKPFAVPSNALLPTSATVGIGDQPGGQPATAPPTTPASPNRIIPHSLRLSLSDDDQELMQRHVYCSLQSEYDAKQRQQDRILAAHLNVGYTEQLTVTTVNDMLLASSSSSDNDNNTTSTTPTFIPPTITPLSMPHTIYNVEYPLRLRQLDAHALYDDPYVPLILTSTLPTSLEQHNSMISAASHYHIFKLQQQQQQRDEILSQRKMAESKGLDSHEATTTTPPQDSMDDTTTTATAQPSTKTVVTPSQRNTTLTPIDIPPIPDPILAELTLPDLHTITRHLHRLAPLDKTISPFPPSFEVYQSPYASLYPYFHNAPSPHERVAVKKANVSAHFRGLSYDHLREMVNLSLFNASYRPKRCMHCTDRSMGLRMAHGADLVPCFCSLHHMGYNFPSEIASITDQTPPNIVSDLLSHESNGIAAVPYTRIAHPREIASRLVRGVAEQHRHAAFSLYTRLYTDSSHDPILHGYIPSITYIDSTKITQHDRDIINTIYNNDYILGKQIIDDILSSSGQSIVPVITKNEAMISSSSILSSSDSNTLTITHPNTTNNNNSKYSLFPRLSIALTDANTTIMNLYDIHTHNTNPLVTLEYVPRTLESIILENHKILTPLLSRRIFYQICLGVKWLHSNYYIHRDLKTNNILADLLPLPIFTRSQKGLSSNVRAIPLGSIPNASQLPQKGVYIVDTAYNLLYGCTDPKDPVVAPSQRSPLTSVEELGRLVCCLADFGGCREYGDPDKHLSPQAGTIWYRAPELMMNSNVYSSSADIWSLGCILGEIVAGQALFKSDPPIEGIARSSELNQLRVICAILGIPSIAEWPEMCSLKNHLISAQDRNITPITLAQFLKTKPLYDTHTSDLLDKMLQWNPAKRLSIDDIINHPYFDPVRPSVVSNTTTTTTTNNNK